MKSRKNEKVERKTDKGRKGSRKEGTHMKWKWTNGERGEEGRRE